MSDHRQGPDARTKRRLLLAGGLTFLFLFLAGAAWFASHFSSLPNGVAIPGSNLTTPSFVAPETEGTPQEIPEAVPEEDAPSTPASGFTDTFDAGLAPAWSVIYGHPLVANGQLTSDVGAGIAAGDSSWENYQIEFDVDTHKVGCLFADTSNSVGIRVTDYDHAYWFVFTDCSAAWSLFAGGVPNLLPDSLVKSSNGTKHMMIKVEEAQMSAYENGALSSSISDIRFHNGGIFLQIEAETLYDNFQVTLLP